MKVSASSSDSDPDSGWPSSRLSVNISILFRELPMRERPAAAKAAGFDAIEMWWPFPVDPDPGQVSELVQAVERARVAVVSLNLDTGDASAGERGLMCRPERLERLRRSLPLTIEIAERLGCPRLNALYGNVEPDHPRSHYHEAALEAYGYA